MSTSYIPKTTAATTSDEAAFSQASWEGPWEAKALDLAPEDG